MSRTMICLIAALGSLFPAGNEISAQDEGDRDDHDDENDDTQCATTDAAGFCLITDTVPESASPAPDLTVDPFVDEPVPDDDGRDDDGSSFTDGGDDDGPSSTDGDDDGGSPAVDPESLNRNSEVDAPGGGTRRPPKSCIESALRARQRLVPSTDSAGLDTDGSFSVTYYERVCTDGTRAIVRREAPAAPPADPAAPPEPPPPDPEDLARELYGEMILTVPTPTIRVAPAETNDDGWVFVQHPSFFWIDEWQAISSTLTVGSISTTLTFSPERLDIDPGDGEQVSCAAAPAFPAGSDPTTFNGCEHIYRHSSSVAPNGESYPVEATMVWTATWTSNIGVGGNLGELSTTGTRDLQVAERQAIITGT